jgi:hypothetical protein
MAKQGRTKPVEADSPLDSLGGNSYLHVKRMPNPLFGPPPSIVETVFFSKVGHTFGPMPIIHPGQPQMYLVQDFLMDQTGASGADGKMAGTTQFDLTTSTSYRVNIFPKDRSKRIKVAPPASVQVHIGLDCWRRFVNAASDYADQYPANTFFVNLQGSAPVFSYNYFFIGRNTNHWTGFTINAETVTPFSFLGFTTIGSYPMRSFDPGTKAYIPHSFSLPFNLPGPNSVPYLMFGYQTSSSTDPGPFVFLG